MVMGDVVAMTSFAFLFLTTRGRRKRGRESIGGTRTVNCGRFPNFSSTLFLDMVAAVATYPRLGSFSANKREEHGRTVVPGCNK